jgi:hypothetical protein
MLTQVYNHIIDECWTTSLLYFKRARKDETKVILLQK